MKNKVHTNRMGKKVFWKGDDETKKIGNKNTTIIHLTDTSFILSTTLIRRKNIGNQIESITNDHYHYYVFTY